MLALKGELQGLPSCSIRSFSRSEVNTISSSNFTSIVVAYSMVSCYSIIINLNSYYINHLSHSQPLPLPLPLCPSLPPVPTLFDIFLSDFLPFFCLFLLVSLLLFKFLQVGTIPILCLFTRILFYLGLAGILSWLRLEEGGGVDVGLAHGLDEADIVLVVDIEIVMDEF